MKAFLLVPFIGMLCYNGINPKDQFKVTEKPVKGKTWDLPLSAMISMPMNWIPSGTFVMGSPATEPGRKADEGPQTTVTLSKGYWLGATEVTIKEWKAITGVNIREKAIALLNDTIHYDFNGKKMLMRDFMGFDKNNPDKILASEDDNLPMYFVSWNEAMEFCRKLTAKEKAAHRLPAGYAYTLPTEAQWEYACRAGTKGPIYGGSTAQVAWYVGNSYQGYTGKGFGKPNAGPRDAALKLPNQWGMYDMLGNLWEWCRDWYGPYPGGNITDPTGPANGTYRVNRGGSFGSGVNDERSANRATNPPNEESAYRGFRVALCIIK